MPYLNSSEWWWWCNGVGIFNWHTLGPLVPIEYRLNATAYLSIVAEHVHPFMTTAYPSSDGYVQQDNAPCHKISNHLRLVSWTWQWVHFTQMASTVTRSQSNVVEREIRIIDVLLTNLQQLRDAVQWASHVHCQYGPKSQRNVSNTLLNLYHK